MFRRWLRKKAPKIANGNGQDHDDDLGLKKAMASEEKIYQQSEQLTETRDFETKARRLERRATDPQCKRKETKVMKAIDAEIPEKEVENENPST